MSAFGPKRTLAIAAHMCAFGGKADMTFCAHMSAFDPKQTSRVQCQMSAYGTQCSGAGFLSAEECAYDKQPCQSTYSSHCLRRVGNFGRSNGDGQGRWWRPWRWR